jgi:hypothetical protein
MSASMTKFHGFFCNVRQVFCSLHFFLIKKYFSVLSSVFDKTRQEKKSKNINRTLLHSETSEVWFECRKLRKNVTCVRSFYPICYDKFLINSTIVLCTHRNHNLYIMIRNNYINDTIMTGASL